MGNFVSLFGSYGRAAGAIMQVPDVMLDLDDAVYDPNWKNGVHLGLDVGQFVPGLSKIKLDDVIGIPGMIDDGYAAIKNEDILDLITKDDEKDDDKNDKRRTIEKTDVVEQGRKIVNAKDKLRRSLEHIYK